MRNDAAAGRDGPRLGRWLRRGFKTILTLYVGGLLMLYAFQTRLIFPGASTQGATEGEIAPTPGVELVTLTTAGGERVVAAFGAALTDRGEPRPDAPQRPTLLYFYGNGMCLRWCVDADLERFRRLGFNVLIPDYVGYGLSSGVPGEPGCYATADACYDHLHSRTDVDPDKIVLVGRSLGGAVAIDLAARRPVAGLVSFCTFTRMVEMAHRRFPFLPAKLLLRHKFDSLGKIGNVTCPMLFGHGSDDRFVPPAMSAVLAAAATAPVNTFTVEGADHGDFYERGGKQVLDALKAFTERVTGESRLDRASASRGTSRDHAIAE